MKSKLMWFTVMTLFAALTIPLRLTAQEQEKKHTRYKLLDLGTLGGPQSVVSGALTQLLNNRGTVAGCSDTPTADPNYPDFNFQGFSPATPDPQIFHGFRWQEGAMTDLDALPGVNNSCPIWMSENGMIAGGSENGTIDPVTGSPESRATLWKDEEVINLGTLGGGESLALAMNNRGQVVGAAADTISDRLSLFGFATQTRAFLWQNGVMKDLDTLGGPDAFAASINERGHIAGCSYTNSTPNPSTGVPTEAPFLWQHGEMTNLGTLGGTSGCASLINNHDQVIGGSNLKGDKVAHAFFWDRGVLEDLSKNVGENAEIEWLDDAGEVVGNTFGADMIRHAFLWKDGIMTHLGTLPGDVGSAALGVNEGRVVGVSGNARGFLWENGGPMEDLNTLIPPNSILQPVVPIVINDRAEIAGTGFLPNGDAHAFLLIPCDENHPGVDGCDYSTVDAVTAAQTPAPRYVPSGTQRPPHSWRSNRYHIYSRFAEGGVAALAAQVSPVPERMPPPPFFFVSVTPLTPSSVNPGGSSTSAVTAGVTGGGGGAGTAALTCSVQPSPPLAPTCSISPTSLSFPGTPATLTVSTSGPSGRLLSHPASGLLYALWLPLIGLVATGVGLGSSQNGQKGKLRTAALACALFAGLTFQVACGGRGSSGTPAGTYTINVAATAFIPVNSASDSVPLTVR